MFLGNQEKKIPKDFKECYKTDSITQNLWLWCERLEKWGKILFWILIIIGVIDTIIAGINAHELIEQIGAETVEEIREASAEMGIEIPTVFEALVNNLLSLTLYSFLEYCAYHILALLIGSLASIVQHTKITANVTLYNSAKTEGVTYDLDDDEQDCHTNETNINNQQHINFRNKKIHKRKKTQESSFDNAESFENVIFCRVCGAETTNDIDTCHVCGTLIKPIPDGFWRCMGCGEILPADKDKCECGYKR